MLQVENLKVSYENNIAIKNFTNDFKDGTITSIIGPNGSGKSTLLKAIAKLIKKESGNILFLDKNINFISRRELSKNISILMQTNTTPYNFTVKQLIEFGRIPHQNYFQKKCKHDDEIVMEVIEKLCLNKLQDRIVSTLSGGERQRVWIALALVQQPKVLFLDEPTTYLDISHQFEIMQLIKDINAYKKTSIVMVLHDLNQAAQFSDKVIILKNGELIDFGAPEDVFTKELMENVYNICANITFNNLTKSINITPISLKN